MDVNCVGCHKLIVNWSPFDEVNGYVGPPACRDCVDKMWVRMFPTVSLTEAAVLWLLWHRARHERIHTGGHDPYSGDRWTTTIGKLELCTDTTISCHAEISWRGKTLVDLYAMDFHEILVRNNPLMRAMFWLHGVFEEERERSYVEDPYGCLADYE